MQPHDTMNTLPPDLLRRCHERSVARHVWRVAIFIVLYAVGAAGAVLAASWVTAWWQWLLVAPLYLLAAGALHGISLFTHEGVHGTLSSRPWWESHAEYRLRSACASELFCV